MNSLKLDVRNIHIHVNHQIKKSCKENFTGNRFHTLVSALQLVASWLFINVYVGCNPRIIQVCGAEARRKCIQCQHTHSRLLVDYKCSLILTWQIYYRASTWNWTMRIWISVSFTSELQDYSDLIHISVSPPISLSLSLSLSVSLSVPVSGRLGERRRPGGGWRTENSTELNTDSCC